MSRLLRVKIKTGGKNHDYKNMKEFSYQADVIKRDKVDQTVEETDEETGEKADEETDEETILDWIHRPKDGFDKIINKVTRYKADGLSTKTDRKKLE